MFWRVYIDKKVTAKGGGEHSRVFDCEADNEQAALNQLELKRGEVAGQIVSLHEDPR